MCGLKNGSDGCLSHSWDVSDSADGAPAPFLLNNQYQEQLSPTHLRAFDHQRTALTQLGFGLEQKFLLLVELKIQNVPTRSFTAGVYVESKKFARGKPIFLTGLKSFLRLPDHLKFV